MVKLSLRDASDRLNGVWWEHDIHSCPVTTTTISSRDPHQRSAANHMTLLQLHSYTGEVNQTVQSVQSIILLCRCTALNVGGINFRC